MAFWWNQQILAILFLEIFFIFEKNRYYRCISTDTSSFGNLRTMILGILFGLLPYGT